HAPRKSGGSLTLVSGKPDKSHPAPAVPPPGPKVPCKPREVGDPDRRTGQAPLPKVSRCRDFRPLAAEGGHDALKVTRGTSNRRGVAAHGPHTAQSGSARSRMGPPRP